MKNQFVFRNGSRRRRRFSPTQIEQFLDEFDHGDVSAAEFVRQHGLCYSTFCRWRTHREQHGGDLGKQPTLEPVPLGSLLGGGWAAEIAWPEGPTLRLHERAPLAWAGALLEALRRPC